MRNLPIAVLLSGNGTTFENLQHWKLTQGLPIDFQLVISSRESARGLQLARENAIVNQVVRRRDFVTSAAHSEAIFSLCREHRAQLVVMAGYIEHLLIPSDFVHRVVNIHPSLIPAFCGQGFYGLKVHQAAIDYGVRLTGCTVHFVDNEYDHGPIIAQRMCPVLEADTAESLQQRVFDVERQLYPEAIAAIAAGNVQVAGRKVKVNAIF
ncbi:MAG: phosphoribosylglycinamide formyltransferase [Planctomycetales bacterium]|nr:phosphoribosylglycinamide formyltransferase [Planctomycetales bacterium]